MIAPYRDPGPRLHAVTERRPEKPDRVLNVTIIVLGLFGTLWLTFGLAITALHLVASSR